jgi:hypothetical protein
MASSCIDVAISHCPFGCNPWQLSLTPRSTGDVDGLDDGGGAPRSEQHLDEHLRPQPKVHLDRTLGNEPRAAPKWNLDHIEKLPSIPANCSFVVLLKHQEMNPVQWNS